MNFRAMTSILPIIPKLRHILNEECVNTMESLITGERLKKDDDNAITEHQLFWNRSSGFGGLLLLTRENTDLVKSHLVKSHFMLKKQSYIM